VNLCQSVRTFFMNEQIPQKLATNLRELRRKKSEVRVNSRNSLLKLKSVR